LKDRLYGSSLEIVAERRWCRRGESFALHRY
jgi:hypothetical protein